MDNKGVSPVIAVLLMVAITIILAGVTYLFIISLVNTSEENPTYGYFNISLDPESDIIEIENVQGEGIDCINNTLNIESITITLPIGFTLKVGEVKTIDLSSQIDIIRDVEYKITITDLNKQAVIYSDDVVAKGI